MNDQPLILALDVDYRDGDIGVASGVWFSGWESSSVVNQTSVVCRNIQPYVPGEFYKRELPCLLDVLKCGPRPDIVIIDGYVWTGENQMGLGAHLAQETFLSVVGVAKTRYDSAPAYSAIRGSSTRPLYVTSSAMEQSAAGKLVEQMHGGNRLPTMLKLVDRLCRDTSI